MEIWDNRLYRSDYATFEEYCGRGWKRSGLHRPSPRRYVRGRRPTPMLVGILMVLRLPPQCTFWRLLASLRIQIASQILQVQR
jgi:hypothetical protein